MKDSVVEVSEGFEAGSSFAAAVGERARFPYVGDDGGAEVDEKLYAISAKLDEIGDAASRAVDHAGRIGYLDGAVSCVAQADLFANPHSGDVSLMFHIDFTKIVSRVSLSRVVLCQSQRDLESFGEVTRARIVFEHEGGHVTEVAFPAPGTERNQNGKSENTSENG